MFRNNSDPKLPAAPPLARASAPIALPAFAAEATGSWFVLHTKSRQEKALAADLERMEIPYYLPQVTKARFHGRRRVSVSEALFPSYLFLRGTREEAFSADRTKRVANIIDVPNQERMDWELRNLWVALGCGATLDPYPFLKLGRRVTVRSGPFQGLQGFVEERLTWNRLVLAVEMLGQAVSLEIDGSLLEPID